MKKALASFLALLLLFFMASFVHAEVTLRLVVFEDADDDNLSIQDAIAGFQSAHPDVTVALEAYSSDDYYKALENQFIARQSPDIFIVEVEQLVPLTMTNRLEPLDAYIDAFEYPIEDIIETLSESFTDNEALYGIAKDYNTVCLFYNMDMFEELGISPPETESELLEAAIAFLPYEIVGLSLQNDISCWYPAFAVPNGAARYLNQRGYVVDSPEAVEALRRWADLFERGVAKTPEQLNEASLMDAFGKGLAAMIFETGEICKSIDNNYPNLRYGVVPIPMAEQKGSSLYATAYAISSESLNKEMAFQLIAHLTNEDSQYAALPYQNALPSLKSLRQTYIETYPKWEAFPEACEDSAPFAFGIASPAITGAVNQALQNAMRGMEPALALENAQKVIDAFMFEE